MTGAQETIIMPHNQDAEQGLLGCLLVDNRELDRVGDFFRAEYFFLPAHERIYNAIVEITERGGLASPVTLKNYFEGDNDLKGVGGAEYLAQLAGSVISTLNTEDYARTVRELFLRRSVINIADDTRSKAHVFDLEHCADKVIEGAEEQLFALSEKGISGGPVPLAESLNSTMEMIDRAQKGEQIGLPTGINALDEKIGGLEAGDLIILAGRPSMGKTVMGQTIAYNVARAGHKSLFFSLEMSAQQLVMRFLARESGIPPQAQRRAKGVNPEGIGKLVAAQGSLAKLPLSIDDSGGLSVQAIRSRVRRHKRRYGCDLVVIDQLSHIAPPDRIDNPVQYLGMMTRSLKAMAKDLDVPVILLHQINRAVEGRENKRPGLHDLRDSGAIEQDADIVLFLYRAEYYLEREEPVRGKSDTEDSYYAKQLKWENALREARGKAEAIIGKQRMGEPGIVKMSFSGVRQVFSDVEGG